MLPSGGSFRLSSMEVLMVQVLSYCTAKLFSHAVFPMVMIKPRPVASANDDDPLAPLPSVWQ